MSAVGQVVPCPGISHYDHCEAPACKALRATAHDGCMFCEGSRWVRIIMDRGHTLECEPSGPPIAMLPAGVVEGER